MHAVQVWPLTQFFLLPFVKTHWKPLIGETLFYSAPPGNSLVSVSDPWRAFRADTAPFKGPRVTSWVALELQGYKDTVRCAAQNTANSNWRKTWLCLCRKHTSFQYPPEEKLFKLVTRPVDMRLVTLVHFKFSSSVPSRVAGKTTEWKGTLSLAINS